MGRLAERVKDLEESMTLALSSKAKEMKSKGEDVVNLSAGEPDLPPPEFTKELLEKAFLEGTHKYAPSRGIPELITAIVEKFKYINNIDYKKEEVMVTVGAKYALFLIFQVLLNEGDEVIIPTPYWLSYKEQIEYLGAKVILIHTDIETEYKTTAQIIEKHITPRTKAILINSPNNPTGTVYTRKELEDIAELAYAKNIWIISDEVYEEFVYDGAEHVSIASIDPKFKEITITVNALSKTFSIPGWRLGYVGGPKDIIDYMVRLQSHSTSCAPSILQKVAVDMLKKQKEIMQERIKIYNERREYIYNALKEIKGIKVFKPKGAFYIFPDVSYFYNEKIKGSMDFSMKLLEKYKVVVVPGDAFEEDRNIRISYAVDIKELEKAVERIKRFVEELLWK